MVGKKSLACRGRGRRRRAADAIVGQKEGGKSVKTYNTDPWLEATRRDGVAHQRDAQLTWWSILQGIAMGEFVMRMPDLWEQALSSHHYYLFLFMGATFFLLIDIWLQMAWAIIILRWPLNALHTMLTSLAGILSVFLATTMGHPVQWLAVSFFLGMVGIAIYAYNYLMPTYLGMPKGYGKKTIGETLLYLVVAGTLWRVVSVNPTEFFYYVAGIFGLFISLFSFSAQFQRMEYERKKVSLP